MFCVYCMRNYSATVVLSFSADVFGGAWRGTPNILIHRIYASCRTFITCASYIFVRNLHSLTIIFSFTLVVSHSYFVF